MLNKEFQNNIRGYNGALSFTSLGVDLDEKYRNNRTGSYTFRIHGTVVHRIRSLFPSYNEKPKFQQILFHDTDNELENRLFNFNGLDRNILFQLQETMHQINSNVEVLKQFSMDLEPSLNLVIKSDNKIDRRICNKPIVPEIAAILPRDEDNYVTSKRDIVIETIANKIKHIDQYNPVYDALQYVLPFMRSEIILPSSFKGGPRHMNQLYQNAMALIRKFGKPDLLITFTCNTNWKEIQENLRSGEQAFNRPYLCARVFKNLKN